MRILVRRLEVHGLAHPLLTLNISLGFLAGYVDAFGFIALFGLFTAHITGNLILLSTEMATPGHTFPILKMFALPAFIIGVAMAKTVATYCQRKKSNALLALYSIEMVLLTAFMLVGVIAGPIQENMSSAAILAGIAGTMAMGVHSACGRLLLPDLTPTAMMTGNVTQLVMDVIEIVHGRGGKRARNQCIKNFWPMVAFGLGALMAAFAYFRLAFYALLLPILLLLLLGWIEARGAKQP